MKNNLLERIQFLKTLNASQRKILFAAVLSIALLIIFCVAVYIPQVNKLREVKRQLIDANTGISEITMMEGGKDLAVLVADLNKQLDKTDDRLPASAEAIISYVSSQARELHIDITQITPGDKKPLATPVANYNVEELPITLVLNCDYKSLGEYLHVLRDTSPFLFRIQQLDMQGSGTGNAILQVHMQLLTYVAKGQR